MTSDHTKARLLVVLIVVAIFAGDVATWGKRVGFIENATYREFQQERALLNSEAVELASQVSVNSPQAFEYRSRYSDYKLRLSRHVFGTTGAEAVLRFSAYLVLLLIILVSLVKLVTTDNGIAIIVRHLSRDRLLLWLLVLLGIASITTLARSGWVYLFAGSYTFLFIFFALTCRWLVSTSSMRFLAVALITIALAQLLLAPVELSRALPMFSGGRLFPERFAGTFSQPTTLGIYAVVSFAFFSVFARTTTLYLLTAPILALVFFSGSATALIALLGLLPTIFYSRITSKLGRTKFWAIIACAAFVIIIAAILIRRPWLVSLTARLENYAAFFTSDFSALTYFFGCGLGHGTNAILLLGQHFNLPVDGFQCLRMSTDSTPLMLTMQIGLIGMILTYILVWRAARSDPAMLPVYITFAISSMTTNILEIFPLNLLLGLLLARSFSTPFHPDPTLDLAGPHPG